MNESGFGLAFADGKRWVIRALDTEAEATVRDLGRVMRLGPARGGAALCAVSGRKQAPGARGLVCRLGPAPDRPTEALRMECVATAIALRSLARNGLLLHGALAGRDGLGFILAGPSGVGKSTASRRLPQPWQSLSDDCVLVVPDAKGRYWAHPWPTWSRLRERGLVASWPVEQAVPLKALLFLRQSPRDRAEPVTITPAAALVMESAFHLPRTVMSAPDGRANRAICAKYLRAAWALAAAVPAFRLHVSRAGRFWNEIERAVPMEPQIDADGRRWGRGTERSSVTRDRNAGAREQRDEDGEAAVAPRRRSVPEPPRHLLAGSPRPRLVRFRVGHRTFLKLVAGGRVVASANDVQKEWHVSRDR